MKQFSIERIQALREELDAFNAIPLNELILTKNNQVIEIPAEVIEDWRFVGLSNTSFVEFEMWEPINFESLKWTLAVGKIGYNESENVTNYCEGGY